LTGRTIVFVEIILGREMVIFTVSGPVGERDKVLVGDGASDRLAVTGMVVGARQRCLRFFGTGFELLQRPFTDRTERFLVSSAPGYFTCWSPSTRGRRRG